jgi:hypothetical protein
MMGRFGAQFLMLDYAGIEYEHIESLEGIVAVSSVFGAQTGNFAPPIIVDGDMGPLSQSYSQCIYIGRKAGLEPAGAQITARPSHPVSVGSPLAHCGSMWAGRCMCQASASSRPHRCWPTSTTGSSTTSSPRTPRRSRTPRISRPSSRAWMAPRGGSRITPPWSSSTSRACAPVY